MPTPRTVLNDDLEPKLYRGEIVNTATGLSDLVRARLPVVAETFTTSPMPFTPRADDLLPQKDDPCLVGIDDQGGEWLIAWQPAGGG